MRISPFLNGRSSGSFKKIKLKKIFLINKILYLAVEIELGAHRFHFLDSGPYQRRRVQIMHFVKIEESRQICEHLVAYPVARLFALLNFVDDIMRNFAVLPVTKNFLYNGAIVTSLPDTKNLGF